MWLVFEDTERGKSYFIEFTGDETIGDVMRMFENEYGVEGGVILSVQKYPLKNYNQRLKDHMDIKDMTRIMVSSATWKQSFP